VNVLFVTWDGPQVSYLEGLFAPVFERLGRSGYAFRVVQFTWAGDARRTAIRRACEARKIPYTAIPVLRRGGVCGVVLTVIRGALAIRRDVRDYPTDLLMPRSTFPGLMALWARPAAVPMAFDADGLPIDERVEFGALKPGGVVHRVLRAVESAVLRTADVVLVRTAFGRDEVCRRAGRPPGDARFQIVVNGRDETEFRPQGAASDGEVRAALDVTDAPLVVYPGSLGPQYCLREMATLVQAIARRRPDVTFLILTGEPERGRELAGLCNGVRVVVRSVPAGDVAKYLSAADLGLSFRAPSLSMRATAPVKIGEYLLSGVPVVGTLLPEGLEAPGPAGVLQTGVLHTIDTSRAEAWEAAAGWFVSDLLPARDLYRHAARALGLAHFSLARAEESYRDALDLIRRL
jgi:glycosyltransferase involved in cell wall biosynthesis